jgi:membrane fusion protein
MVSYARKQTVGGWVRPDQGVVQVFSEQQGVVIDQVLVAEGQSVEAGQPLMILRESAAMLDGTPAAARLQTGLQREHAELQRQLAATLEQTRLKERRLRSDLQALEEELAQLRAQQIGQQRRVSIAKDLLEQRQALVSQGFVSGADAKQTEERWLEMEQTAAALERSRLLKQHEAQARRHDLEALPAEGQASAAALRERLAALEPRLAELSQRERLAVTAPVAGRIGSLRLRRGEPITNPEGDRQALLDILPRGALLQAELFAPSQAVGLIKPGAPVRLRLDSYPYEKFGSAEGRVLSIAPTSSMPAELPQGPAKSGPVFRVVVELAQQHIELDAQHRYPLQPGMTLSADVLLERRRLVEYLLAPLLGSWPGR